MSKLNTKERLLAVLSILISRSDSEHFIASNAIVDTLAGLGYPCDRKTIVEDIKALRSYFSIISSHGPNAGYSIEATPFTRTEVKVLTDLVSGFGGITTSDKKKLIAKLYAFTSVYNQDLFRAMARLSTSRTTTNLYDLDAILSAIAKGEYLKATIRGKEGLMTPYLLDIDNDTYYLYYSYPDNDHIYHVRIDNLRDIETTDKAHLQPLRFADCFKLIDESVASYVSQDLKEVRLALSEAPDYIKEDITRSFPSAIFTKDEVVIKVRLSVNFFSKLTAYGNYVKILSPASVVEGYKSFLKDILTVYQGTR